MTGLFSVIIKIIVLNGTAKATWQPIFNLLLLTFVSCLYIIYHIYLIVLMNCTFPVCLGIIQAQEPESTFPFIYYLGQSSQSL